MLTLSKASRAFSLDYGIINHFMKMPRLEGDARLVSYGVSAASLNEIAGIDYTPLSAGCSEKTENAFFAAVGETIERYCSAFVDEDSCIYGSYDELSGENYLISPQEFSLFHEEQFRDKLFSSVITPFTEQTRINWTTAFNLTIGEVCYIPSQVVYLPYNKDSLQVTIGVSTGLSAHTNFHQAILGGLYEVVERDAVAISWLQGLCRDKIKVSSQIQDYINSIYPSNYDWHLFDVTTDIGIPTVFGFCIGKAEFGDFIAVGAASRATLGAALKKTVKEIGQSIPSFRYFLSEKKGSTDCCDDYFLLNSFEDHSYFYLVSSQSTTILKEWIEAQENRSVDLDEPPRYNDVKEEIRWASKRLAAAKCSTIVKDLTTADARQLGFFVVKVVSPQLVPLSGAFRFYFKGGTRLYDVPLKMGYASKSYFDLSPFPHPFP